MLFVPYRELLHCSSFIEQSQAYTPEQVLQVQYTFVRKDPPYSIRGLGTFVEPLERLLTVDLHGCRNCEGIVSTDLLDEFTIAGSPCICYYNEIEGTFFTPVSLESDLHRHKK